MADNEKVLEGFLYSTCVTDFKAPLQLTKHSRIFVTTIQKF